MQKTFLVSIIVPVYNGADYLVKTLTSIKNQTYVNMEVFLVDDNSSDESLSILKRIAKKDNRFKVFSKEHGGMVPKTMNFIMPQIKGNYFYYTSQDDIFSEDLIEKLVKKQLQTNADAVLPDMEFYHENKDNNKRVIGLNCNRDLVLTGKQALIESLNWNIHGFALFKTSLMQGESYPEDSFDSDEYVTRKLFLKSNKVVFSKGVFYYRQDNANAITKTFTVKNFYVINTIYKLYNLMLEHKIDRKYILDSQEQLLKEYIKKYAIYQFYPFQSKLEANGIADFLCNFKEEKLTITFLVQNLGYAIAKLRIKYIMVYFIYKWSWLFKIVKLLYTNFLKRRIVLNIVE